MMMMKIQLIRCSLVTHQQQQLNTHAFAGIPD
jgi:hypothetical protein